VHAALLDDDLDLVDELHDEQVWPRGAAGAEANGPAPERATYLHRWRLRPGTYDLRIVGGSAAVATRTFRAEPEGTEITVPLADYETDGRGIRGILFAAVGSARSFAFAIDGVRFR
jgi:hypothetical protein